MNIGTNMEQENDASTSQKIDVSSFQSIDEMAEKPLEATKLMSVTENRNSVIFSASSNGDDNDEDNNSLDMASVGDKVCDKPLMTIDIEDSLDENSKTRDESTKTMVVSLDTSTESINIGTQTKEVGGASPTSETQRTASCDSSDNTNSDSKSNTVKNSLNRAHTSNFFNKSITVHNLSCKAWIYRPKVNGKANLQRKNAWERRCLVLAGTKILQYKLTAKDVAESMGTFAYGCQMSPRTPGTHHESESFGASGMLNLLKTCSRVRPVTSFKHEIESEVTGPTPFGVELKVGEIEWKICFDCVETHAQWTAALVDVVERLKYLVVRKKQLEDIQRNGQPTIILEEKKKRHFFSFIFDWKGSDDEAPQNP